MMMFTTPMPVNKTHTFGIKFIQNGIINYKKLSLGSDKILNFFHKASVSGAALEEGE